MTPSVLVKGFGNPKDCDDQVNGAVALVPELVEFFHCRVDIAFQTALDDSLNNNRVWLVANFENVVTRHESKARMGGLKVVDRLSHVAFGREYQSC